MAFLTDDGEGADTPLRFNANCEDWNVSADHDPVHPDEFLDYAALRRIGWIDQKGRVYTKIPPSLLFDGGSLTPLLIDVRET